MDVMQMKLKLAELDAAKLKEPKESPFGNKQMLAAEPTLPTFTGFPPVPCFPMEDGAAVPITGDLSGKDVKC